ncbi:MAG: cytidylate kinase-like family protein [Bacillota bacterium]
MERFAITISRASGSGGRDIGRALADALGVNFYDRELLRLASDESGIHEGLFGKADETPNLRMLLLAAKSVANGDPLPPDSDDFISNENLFSYQAKVIRELASKESCVIIGRCADYVLRDYPNVVRISIQAPLDYRVKAVMALNDIDEREAKHRVELTDRRRSGYYRYFTGRDWLHSDNYDLCVNSAALSREQCVKLIQSYLSIRFQ